MAVKRIDLGLERLPWHLGLVACPDPKNQRFAILEHSCVERCSDSSRLKGRLEGCPRIPGPQVKRAVEKWKPQSAERDLPIAAVAATIDTT